MAEWPPLTVAGDAVVRDGLSRRGPLLSLSRRGLGRVSGCRGSEAPYGSWDRGGHSSDEPGLFHDPNPFVSVDGEKPYKKGNDIKIADLVDVDTGKYDRRDRRSPDV